MSHDRPALRTRRLNARALAILGALAALAAPALWALKAVQDRNGRAAFLVEARALLARGQAPTALSYLNRYLELTPGDPEALRLKAKVLADGASNPAQAQEAAQAYNQVLGRAPEGPKRQEARRQLARLNLKLGRAQAAEVQARELIAHGQDDAEAHRLLAQARQWIGLYGNDPSALDEARKEYEAAGAADPGDVATAEKLAALYRDTLNRPDEARGVLDRVVKANAKNRKAHAAALLARSRHHLALRRSRKGEAEKKADLNAAEADALQAARDDPADLDVRLNAAEIALQARDLATARHHLAEVAGSAPDDLRVKLYGGIIDLYDQRPEEAIRQWRAGLLQAGGTSDDLTWRLANLLVETGRTAEARPLIDQYRRLIGDDPGRLPRYHYLNGLALLKSGRPAEAVAELGPVRYKIEKELESPACFALGMAHEAAGDEAGARDAYRQAAELSADWNGPWVALARIEAAADPAAAAATLRRGLTLSGGSDPGMLTELARCLYLAELKKDDASKRSWTEVEKVLGQARSAAPGSPDLARVEADFYAASGRTDDALALLKAANGLNPKASETWLARADLLARLRRPGEALEVLDRGEEAAGPQAAFAVARASALAATGRYGEARRALTDALGRLPDGEKPLVLKNLGELSRSPEARDDAAARDAYRRWAALRPADPAPRVALFELALDSGDERAVTDALAAVKEADGPGGDAWRYVRLADLLRDRPGEAPDPARDASRLAQAEAIAAEVKKDRPRLPLGDLLEGRVREKQGRTDEAIKAYSRAIDRDGWPALGPLLSLLIREGRMGEIAALRETLRTRPQARSIAFDRLAADLAIRQGDKGRAEALARQAAAGDPEAMDVRVWEADVLRALGKPEEAEKALRKLANEKPGEAAPWLQLLMLQVSRGEKVRAAETVEQVRRNVTREEFRPELLLAQCYRVVGDSAKAREAFRQARRRWPNDPNVTASSVTFYEQLGLRDEAEAELRALLKAGPARSWAARRLALILASKPGSRASWEEAIALVGPVERPDDLPDDRIARANVYALSPDPDDRAKAVAILKGLLKDRPDQPRLHDQLARLLYHAGDKAGARAHAGRAASVAGATADTILFYAALLVDAGDASAAEDQLGRLSAEDAATLAGADIRARVLAARGQAEEGARLLEKTFEDRASAPDAVGVGEKMVALLASLGRPEAADRLAARVARLGPKGQCVRAEYLAGLGKAGEALALLDAAARGGDPADAAATALNLATRPGADPRFAETADRLLDAKESHAPSFDRLQKVALLRHFQGKFAQEVETYRAMLALKPTNYLFLNNMAWTLSEDLNRPEEGLRWADEAVKRSGALPHILDTRGVILTRLGRYDRAAEALEKSARASNDPATYFHLARAYRKMGRADEARRCGDRARSLGLTPERLQPSERADWGPVMNP